MREAHSKARKTSYGGIAQLGERLNGIQEVSGSIPLISTKSPELVRFQDFFYITNLQGDVMALNPATASLRRVIAAMPGARGHNDF